MPSSINSDRIAQILKASTFKVSTHGAKTVAVTATLPNGFEITESAACVDPEASSMEVGERIARDRIESRLWALEGYLLAADVYGVPYFPDTDGRI